MREREREREREIICLLFYCIIYMGHSTVPMLFLGGYGTYVNFDHRSYLF